MLLAQTHVVTGLPAAIIIFAILAVLLVGVVALVRFVIRGGRRAANRIAHHDDREPFGPRR